MKKDWHGLVKILEIQHVRNNKIIWEDKNLYNTLHVGGESFILSLCFAGATIPSQYFFGLDARPTISTTDTLSSLVGEPSGNGYLRAAVSSSSGFTIEEVSGVYRASSQIITFTATGAGYGPVTNLFMASTSDNSGTLIASSSLSNSITFAGGDSLNMRMALALKDCP
jgi:hypothetical protein